MNYEFYIMCNDAMLDLCKDAQTVLTGPSLVEKTFEALGDLAHTMKIMRITNDAIPELVSQQCAALFLLMIRLHLDIPALSLASLNKELNLEIAELAHLVAMH